MTKNALRITHYFYTALRTHYFHTVPLSYLPKTLKKNILFGKNNKKGSSVVSS
jgi:hypothetical protein